MALTPVQEGQIKSIVDQYYSQVLDLSGASTEILAALGYGDVRVIDLPVAMPLNASDVFYVAQTGADVRATINQFGQFVFDTFIQGELDAALLALQNQVNAMLAALQLQVNNAIASMIAQVNASISPQQSYFIGQF